MSVGFVADELTSIFIKFCIAINFQWRPERARGSHPLNVCASTIVRSSSKRNWFFHQPVSVGICR